MRVRHKPKNVKLFKAKRAVIFNLFVVIVTLVALVYAFIMLSSKSAIDKKLGLAPLESFMQYQDGDKVLLFLDQAGEISLREASFTLMDEGGVKPKLCDPYYNFTLWTPKVPGCMPDIDSVYSQLGRDFSTEMDARVKNYPNITFMKYYVGSPTASATPQSTVVAAGDIKPHSIVGGTVDVVEDSQITCASHIKGKYCKLVPEAIPALNNIKKYLDTGETLLIVSATRPFNQQRIAFMRYIKDGDPPACGPRAYRQKVYDAIGAPPKKGDAEYHKKVDAYLAANDAVKKGIDDLNNYNGCPHVLSKAIDINIKDSSGNLVPRARTREIMCKADWVNYGQEWWHYEYGTDLWNKQRPDRIPDNLVGSTSSNTYHANCYYGALKV